MKRALCILLLAGCGGASSVIEEVPPDLRKTTSVVPPLADRYPYADPSGVEPGRWAKYREGERVFTLAVAARVPEGTWMEVVEESAASACLVAPDGAVLKAYWQEPGGPAREQPLDQRAEPAAPKRAESSREVAEEKVKIGGRELAAKAVRLRLEDLEGRLVKETWVWHADVPPLYAGGELGGLVRRETSRGKVELLDFGAAAKPAVQRP
ncbi:MAG TPA: hypothetical protein VF950_21350 [Planctomycetota bacterium]